MAIKVKANSSFVAKRTYPYLGDTGVSGDHVYQVVYFIAPNTGVLIDSAYTDVISTCRYSTEWREGNFKPFIGEISLSNA